MASKKVEFPKVFSIHADAVANDREAAGRPNPDTSAGVQEYGSAGAEEQARAQADAQSDAHLDAQTIDITPDMRYPNDAHPNAHLDAQIKPQRSKRVRKQASAGAREHGSAPAGEQARIPVLEDLRHHVPSRAKTGDNMLDDVRQALTRKVIYPGGKKLSVDTDPALADRLDKYCYTHGKLTSRQVFLELVMAFLDAEGA